MSPTCSILLLLIGIWTTAIVSAEQVKLYDNKYDDIDVDSILRNDRQRNQYYKCLIGSSPCLTPDAIFLKEKFPESIVTKCRYCTDKQKVIFEKVIVWYTTNKPDEWNALLKSTIERYQNASKSRA